MLIAIDARESGTTTGRYIDKLIENLAKMDHDHDFNIITNPKRVDFIHKIAPRFAVIKSEATPFTVGEQRNLKKEIKALKADLVHFGMTHQPVLYRGKTVTTMHDLIMTKKEFRDPFKNPLVLAVKQPVYRMVVKIVAKKSKMVMTPTKFIKSDIMEYTGQPAEKFVVTHEAADKIHEKAEPVNRLVGKSFIMYVGRPMPHKNLTRLIDAFETLKANYPDLHLALVGPKDARYEAHATYVKDHGIKNVVFTGWISDGQLRWLYENTAAYIFPSLSEGFGLPGLEAMMHGAPVACSNASCLPEVYGDAVQYFDPTSVEDMADNISKVIGDYNLRQRLIAKGYEQVAKYSWERMAKQTMEVYDKVLSA